MLIISVDHTNDTTHKYEFTKRHSQISLAPRTTGAGWSPPHGLRMVGLVCHPRALDKIFDEHTTHPAASAATTTTVDDDRPLFAVSDKISTGFTITTPGSKYEKRVRISETFFAFVVKALTFHKVWNSRTARLPLSRMLCGKLKTFINNLVGKETSPERMRCKTDMVTTRQARLE